MESVSILIYKWNLQVTRATHQFSWAKSVTLSFTGRSWSVSSRVTHRGLTVDVWVDVAVDVLRGVSIDTQLVVGVAVASVTANKIKLYVQCYTSLQLLEGDYCSWLQTLGAQMQQFANAIASIHVQCVVNVVMESCPHSWYAKWTTAPRQMARSKKNTVARLNITLLVYLQQRWPWKIWRRGRDTLVTLPLLTATVTRPPFK